MKYAEEHKEELRSTPVLRSLEKRNIFRVPDRYFESFPERLMNRIEDLEAVESAPLLMSFKKVPLYDAPEGYFDDLPSDIQHTRIASGEKQKQFDLNALWKWIFVPKYSLSIAAVILFFVMGVWYQPGQSANELEELSMEELVALIDYQDLDAQMLFDFVGDEELDIMAESFFSEPNVSGDALDLLLEQLDLSELEQMLN